mmetsp:Transcript_28544/g.32342  ORF Transcript_28544/g.32342 Transcript_28544/m.32342 type:complete len:376 (+) Transcript_28544:151-1278(+)
MILSVTKRGMVQTAMGSIFYLLNDGRTPSANKNDTSKKNIAGKTPILCFHMTPRSSDEYLEVLPLLAAGTSPIGDDDGTTTTTTTTEQDAINGRVVIAFDIPGYGASENPLRSCTIDEISDAFLMAADSILQERTTSGDECESSSSGSSSSNYITIGSLLGNYFCVSLASRYPERIKAGILTNPWYCPGASDPISSRSDTTDSAAAAGTTTIIDDSFVLKDDGSHLVELHSKRSSFLDPELNFRVVHSEIAYLANRRIRYRKGISIQGGMEYDFQTPVKKIVEMRRESNADACSNFMCVLGDGCATLFDRFGLDGTTRFEEACQLLSGTGDTTSSDSGIVRVERLVGEKSSLNVINQMPEEFAALCNNFLSERGL